MKQENEMKQEKKICVSFQICVVLYSEIVLSVKFNFCTSTSYHDQHDTML